MTRSTSIPGRPEGGQGELEGGRGALGALVGDLDDDASPAAIVDDDLEMVVAGTPLQASALGRAAEDAVAAAIGDPAQLLVVLVDEGTRMTGLVAADGQARRPIEVGQAGHARAIEDRGDGRSRMPRERTETVGTPAPLGPGGQDPLDLGGRRGSGRAVGSGAPIGETRRAFGPKRRTHL